MLRHAESLLTPVFQTTKLPLRQRNALAVVVQHVFDVHGGGRNPQNTVSPVDDVAFGGDEDVLTRRQEDLLRLSCLARKTKKLQVDGRRRWYRRGTNRSRVHYRALLYRLNRFRSRDKNVPRIARILDLLVLA